MGLMLKINNRIFKNLSIFKNQLKRFGPVIDFERSAKKYIYFNGVRRRDCYTLFPFFISSEKIDHIHILGNANFGNAVIKLSNAICVAKELGIVSITHEMDKIFNGKFMIDGVSVEFSTANYNSICGEFLNRLSTPNKKNFEKFDKYVRLTTLEYTDRFLESYHSKLDFLRSTDCLVIHLRSGDVFNRNNPHPLYGQPPMSFYKKILLKEKPSRVVVVSEDRSNPILNLIEEYCGDNGVAFDFAVSSMEEDIARLAMCNKLVLSRGTFCGPTILGGCKKEKIYLYDYYSDRWVFGKDEVEYWSLKKYVKYIERINELNSAYREKVTDHWENSIWQREKLVDETACELSWEAK